MVEKVSASSSFEPRTSRSAGQCLTYGATRTPISTQKKNSGRRSETQNLVAWNILVSLTLLHSERPKLYASLVFLSVV